MPSMSYCRHENAYHNLMDCWEQWEGEPDSEIEIKYRILLIKLCKKIAAGEE